MIYIIKVDIIIIFIYLRKYQQMKLTNFLLAFYGVLYDATVKAVSTCVEVAPTV